MIRVRLLFGWRWRKSECRLCWTLYGMLPHRYHVRRLHQAVGKVYRWSSALSAGSCPPSSALACLIWKARGSSSTCWPFQSRLALLHSFHFSIWAPLPPRPVVCHIACSLMAHNHNDLLNTRQGGGCKSHVIQRGICNPTCSASTMSFATKSADVSSIASMLIRRATSTLAAESVDRSADDVMDLKNLRGVGLTVPSSLPCVMASKWWRVFSYGSQVLHCR